MNRDGLLELRILSGTHAGARVLLPQTAQTLGSDRSCDLILTDEGIQGHHLTLEAQADGTVLVRMEGQDEPLALKAGEGVALGPVDIALAPADSPWTDEVPLRSLGHGAEHPEAPQPAEGAAAPAPAPARSAAGPSLHRPLRAAVALALFMGLGAAAVWWLRQPPSPAEPPPPPPAAPATAKPNLELVHLALAPLNLGGRILVTQPQRGATPVVLAAFLSDEDGKRLQQALASLAPRPRLQMVDEQDVRAAINDATSRLAAEGAGSVRSQYLGDGRFRLEGRLADDTLRTQLEASLRRQFPPAVVFEVDISTPAEVANRLLKALRGQGVGTVAGQWKDGLLQVEVTLAASERGAWERALLAAAARHDVPFRAALAFQERPAGSLPFTIRSVVGSELPYVTLADGSRLAEGGWRQGWQLVVVQPQAVIFENRQGARLTLER